MSGPKLWLTLLAMGLVTYALRLSFIAFSDRLRVPPLVQRALRFVPVAVLPAIIVPAIVFRDGTLELTLSNEKLLAGLVAAVVAWYSKNIVWTLLAGMVALWTLQALL